MLPSPGVEAVDSDAAQPMIRETEICVWRHHSGCIGRESF
jgi:hypothetical protein